VPLPTHIKITVAGRRYSLARSQAGLLKACDPEGYYRFVGTGFRGDWSALVRRQWAVRTRGTVVLTELGLRARALVLAYEERQRAREAAGCDVSAGRTNYERSSRL